MSGVKRLLALVVAGAAGFGGWVGVDHLVIAESDTVPLPELGDGLPTARLDEPEPWRRFQLSYVSEDYAEHYWFDLDQRMIRSEVVTPERTDAAEIHDDTWFYRTGEDGEWVEQDPTTTRTIASFAMGGVGPFLLTDLVPPDTLGFTSLELEGTSKGERVYEVTVDAATLEVRHPLAYNRWVATTRILGEGQAVFRIRVRPDGYILRIDNGEAAAIWTDLPDGVRFESPLALLVPTTVPTTGSTTVPATGSTTVPATGSTTVPATEGTPEPADPADPGDPADPAEAPAAPQAPVTGDVPAEGD